MAIYHFTLPWVVLDSAAGDLVKNRSDGVLLSVDGVQVQATTALGVPTAIRTGPAGTTTPFQASIPAGRVRFGDVEAAVFCDENANAVTKAEAAAATAAQALASIQVIGQNASEISYIFRDTAGDVWVSDTPVVVGGGKPRVDAAGDVWVDFPLT